MEHQLLFLILLLFHLYKQASSIDYRDHPQDFSQFINVSKVDQLKSKEKNQNKFMIDKNQYAFNKKFLIPETFSKLQHINILQNDTIALDGTDSGTKYIKIFSGPDYQVKKNQINASQNSKIKFSNNKIYINDEYSISQYSQYGNELQKYQITEAIAFTGSYLITDKYMLFQAINYGNFYCLSMIKIDRITKKMQLIYPNGTIDCNCEQCYFKKGQLIDLQNEKIAYKIDSSIYILNKQTLTLQDTFSSYPYFDYWYDYKTNQSIILLKQWNEYKKYVLNKVNDKYQLQIQIFQQDWIKLVGLNQMYSIQTTQQQQQYSIWNINFQPPYIYIDWNYGDQNLINRSLIQVLKSQEQIIMYNKFQNSIQFYELNQSDPQYKIRLIQQIKLNITTYYKSGYLSSDQKYIFITSSLQNLLLIYNIDNKKLTNITVNNYIGYCLFNSDYNRFIILYSKNQTIDNVNITTYWIQIRSLTYPQTIIKQIKLVIPQTIKVFDIKILTNYKWGLSFLVIYKTKISNDKSKQQLCNIYNDQLTQNKLLNKLISNSYTFPLQDWIFTFVNQNNGYYSRTIYIYYRTNISLATTFSFHYRNFYVYMIYPIIKGNKFFMRTPIDGTLLSFDLDTNDFRQFKQSKLYNPYCKLQMNFPQYTMYFPKKQILYMYRLENHIGTYIPQRIILNSNFPITNKIIISNIKGISQLYILKRNNRDCDLIVDYAQQSLRVWKNCVPYEQIKKYSLPKFKSFTIFQQDYKIYQTSSKKHIFLQYTTQNYSYKYEVREIDNDFKIVWQTQFWFNAKGFNNADLTKDNKLMIINNKNVEITDFNPVNPAINYKLTSISSFDTSAQGILAISGQNIISTDQNRITSFIVLDKQNKIKLQANIQNNSLTQAIISIDQNGQRVIFCYKLRIQTFFFEVWNVTNKQLIYKREIIGQKVNQIRFIENNQIYINVDSKICIIWISSQQKYLQNNLLSFPTTSLYTINKDGTLFAFVTGNTTVDIFDSNQNIISHIQLQNASSSILSLAFSANNSLFIVDKNSTIFVFSKRIQCPKTFVDIRSQCVCRNYSTKSGQTCLCNQNFVEIVIDESCGCLDPFILIGQNCSCRNNQTQVGNSCQCNKNFMKNNFQCLCQNPFKLINNKCQCPANNTQSFNKCICSQNFIKKNELCVCPESFIFQKGSCFCENGKYLLQNLCHDCSFWCQQCIGSGLSCISYSKGFYLIIIVLGVILMVVFIKMIFCNRKKLNKKNKGQESGDKYSQQQISADIITDQQLKKALKE